MSHAVVIVLTRKGQTVEELMAPYDENIDVEPYQTDCGCVGREAEKFGQAQAEEEFPIDELRTRMGRLCPMPESKGPFDLTTREEEPREEMWRALLAPRDLLEKRLIESHAAYQKPDPKCEECKGSGKVESTYNPKSKWDWYAEGGRWPNILNGKNKAKVKDLTVTDETTPLAVLTPDGEWIEKGTLGWWGMVHNPKKQDEWQEQVRAIYKKYYDATATAIDYHI